ncbi:MAG: type II toxin-antitoxin system VapC family toxin [Melioribacteraceae bacterium]|nr:type II toxin-antitoxin system VapC family toxin [Melioribacteraceae bacterium]
MKSKKYVLDSYALFSYIEGERGAKIVAEILKSGINNKVEIFMSVINWGEVYYTVLREQDKRAAELYLKTIERYPITIVDVSKTSTLESAEIKAFYKMSYADAFAVSLAINKKANLVTGDKEFESISDKVNVTWI